MQAFERGLARAEEQGEKARASRAWQAGLLMAGGFEPGPARPGRYEAPRDPMLREPGFGREREPELLAAVAFERALAGRRSARRGSELAERALEGGRR